MCFPLLGVGDFVDREGLKGFGLRGEYANSEYGIPLTVGSVHTSGDSRVL